MDTLWRLAWALPLVLMIGIGAILILRRWVVPAQPATPPKQRISMRGSLLLSEDTCAHLIEVDGKPYLIVESARPTVLQSALLRDGEVPRPSSRFTPSWVQRFYKAGSR